MMSRSISYKQAIELAIENTDMVLYLEEMIMNHKNWGSFSVRKVPSYVIVNLVERIKQLAEQQLGESIPIDVDDDEV
jgi:hypothetical protein